MDVRILASAERLEAASNLGIFVDGYEWILPVNKQNFSSRKLHRDK